MNESPELLAQDLQEIEKRLRKLIPKVICEWAPPANPTSSDDSPQGTHFLDITLGAKHVVIEVSPERTYGVTRVDEDTMFGIKPDHVFQADELEDMIRHVVGFFRPN